MKWVLKTSSPAFGYLSLPLYISRGVDSMLVLGGYNSGTKNAIWRSDDGGETWYYVTAAAEWPARSRFGGAILSDGHLVITAGYHSPSSVKDAWNSTTNGRVWYKTNSSVPFGYRVEFGYTRLLDDSLLIYGGRTFIGSSSTWDDVWKTSDEGITWTRLTASAMGSGRSQATLLTLSDGTLLCLGGRRSGTTQDAHIFESSDGGITWSVRLESAPWGSVLRAPAVIDANGTIWVIGPGDGRRVYSSADDGYTWSDLGDAPWTASDEIHAICDIDGTITAFIRYQLTESVWSLKTCKRVYTSIDSMVIGPL